MTRRLASMKNPELATNQDRANASDPIRDGGDPDETNKGTEMSETMPLNSEKFRKYRRQSRVKAVKDGSKEKNIIISDHPRVNINKY